MPHAGETEGAQISVAVAPALPNHELMRETPSVLLHTWRVSSGQNRWVGTIWPANPQAFFVSGVRLRRRSFAQTEIVRQRADYLEPLFDPDVPFTEMAQLLIALALTEAEPEVSGLAADALIELIRDGRCVGPELGSVLGRLMKEDVIKLNRLAKQLEMVARASHLHAHVCAQMVQVACSHFIEIPKDVHHLLGPLLEWLTSLAQEPRSEVRPILEKTSKGKAGALAKRILKLKCEPGVARFAREALQGRLERARRWASTQG